MQSSPSSNVHECPTREDGVHELIAQSVTQPMCQERQRSQYHKCWTCVHRNGSVARRPAPVLEIVPAARRAAEPRTVAAV